MFDKRTYIERREVLTHKFNSGILLFLGNEESPMNFLDNTYHFRQDSSFLYYFGIQKAGLAAIIDIDQQCTVLFGDEMSMDDIVWMGRQKTLKEMAFDSGIIDVRPKSALAGYILNALKMKRMVNFLPPYRAENKLLLADVFNVRPDQLFDLSSVSFIKAVVAQRSVKSEIELIEIDKAVSTSVDMQLLAMKMARPGMKEREIAAAMHQVAQSQGGAIAYPIILTVNGHILHNHYYGNTLKNGDLVLNDSGAETEMGYAGDLTRTFPVGKKFSPIQRDVYHVVLDAYSSAVGLLQAGTKYLDVHHRACTTLAEGLKAMGLMKGNLEDAVSRGAHALFFQCGTGHMMGLDVHDMEDLGEQYVGYSDTLIKNTSQFGLKSLRLGKELVAGNVLTVEPGLYFIPELIDMWGSENIFSEYINYEKLKDFRSFGGIRVEDDFVITQDGSRKLGKELAISVEDIEALRSY